jgi:MoxR-like ATPase
MPRELTAAGVEECREKISELQANLGRVIRGKDRQIEVLVAALEAMCEMQATVEGKRYPLPAPFMVLATENPIEFHGTYPLPEAQMDRFLVYMELGYPGTEEEMDILADQALKHPLESIGQVLATDEIIELQERTRSVRVDESLRGYIVEVVENTRQDHRLRLGASPRASLGLFRASQAAALAHGRDYVLPDDVQNLVPYVLPHRLILNSKAKYDGTNRREVCQEALRKVKVPT